MSITKVERYEYDGRLYDTKEQAEYAASIDNIMEYMDDNPLHVSKKGKVEGREILLWLRMSCPRVHLVLLPEEK